MIDFLRERIVIENNGYPLNQIYFYMTEGCNLRCRHCWLAPKYENGNKKYKHLDIEIIKSVVEQGLELGLKAVKLTGGEPFLNDKIEEIIDFIAEKNIGLIIESNGVLINDNLIEKMKKCKRVFISVSLDGVDKETHEWVRLVEGSFEKALNNVKKLAEAGLKPQMIMSVMGHNKHQLEEFIGLAEKIGAHSVKFNIVMPTERGKLMHENGETLTIEELVAIGKYMEQEVIPKSKIRVIFHHPPAFKPLGSIYRNKEKSLGNCGIKGIIGVLPDGKYALCGIGSSVKEMVFGDAETDKLSDVWYNNRVLKEIREGIPKKLEGICSLCIMKNTCLGSCVAQNYYRQNSLWSPFWFCEMADKAGIFPDSRKQLR